MMSISMILIAGVILLILLVIFVALGVFLRK